MSSLGSLLTVTPGQLMAFHKEVWPFLDEEAFKKEYLEKAVQASKDSNQLALLGVTVSQVFEKLNNIIAEAKLLYNERRSQDVSHLLSTNFRKPSQTVQNYIVRGFEDRQTTKAACDLCTLEIESPLTFEIENIQSGNKLIISELALHRLSHDYFGKAQNHRVDPMMAVRLLGVGKDD